MQSSRHPNPNKPFGFFSVKSVVTVTVTWRAEQCNHLFIAKRTDTNDDDDE